MEVNKKISIFLLLVGVAFAPVHAQFKLYEKGHDSYTSGKYEDAIRYFSEYLTKATRDKAIDVDVFYLRALSYYKLNRFAEAVPDFEETVLRGHDNIGNIYWFMAKCHDKTGRNEDAVQTYKSAIRELNDNEARAKLYHERGLIYERLGDKALAIADFQDGLALNPGKSELKKELDRLKAPYSSPRSATEDKKVAQNNSQNNSQTVAKKTEPAKKISVDDRNEPQKTKTKPQKSNTKPVVKEEKQEEKPEVIVAEAPAGPSLEELYRNERRYALVVGVSKYPKSIGELKNPVNDAQDMAKELEASHFEVDLLTNATYGQIRAALMRFKEKLDEGDGENTVGLFYFAGHGVMFEDENYLVPADATVQYEDDIPRYCFPIQRMVLNNMERSRTRMNIVILDACRNNPFPSLTRSVGRSGLGEMKRARGTFIAYATAPGSVAQDGNGRNGLYTQEVLKAMKKKGLTIEQVFKEVRANVLKLSNNKQNTWDSSNIIGEFHFKY